MKLLRRAIWRDLRARRAQVLLIGVTMVLGVALFGASFDAFQNLTTSYQRLYDDLAFADLTVTGGNPTELATSLASEPGVAAVTTRTVADVPFAIGDQRMLGRVIGLPADGDPSVNRVLILRGRGLDPAQPDGVLVEQHMAGQFGLEPGSGLSVLGPAGWRSVTVLGVVASPEYLWPARSRQEIIVPFDQFGVVFAPESFAAGSPPATAHQETLLRLAPDAPAGTLERTSTAAIAAGAASTMTRAEQPSNAALQEDVSGFGEMSLAFPVLFLGAGALAMSVLLGRLVATHRAQIGVLRAMGYSRRSILGQYLGVGVLVGLAASVPGTILGALAAAVITRLYTGVISVPIAVVDVRPVTLALAIAIGPLAGALAALGPARSSASIAPGEAMRGTAPVGVGGMSFVERLFPVLRRLPMRWRAALRGLFRNRRRSLSTMLGIALATSLIFVSWALVDTVQTLLDRQFVQIDRRDATLILAQPVPASQASSAAAVSGTAAAEPQLTLPVTLVSGSRRYATALAGLPPHTTMKVLIDQDGHVIPLADGEAVLGVALKQQLNVDVGDTLYVEPVASSISAVAPAATEVRVAGFVNEPLGSFAYANLGTAASVAGLGPDPPVSEVLVRYDSGANRQAVRAELNALPNVAAVVDSRALYDTAQSFMGLFYAFVGVMIVLGGVMAFALVFNTMSANVMERSVELTALRALGMSQATIGRLVSAENLLLAAAALVPGFIVAYLLAYEFMASFSSDLFQFDLAVRPITFIGTGVAILVVALLSGWPAIRAVGRLDIARVVRERSV